MDGCIVDPVNGLDTLARSSSLTVEYISIYLFKPALYLYIRSYPEI